MSMTRRDWERIAASVNVIYRETSAGCAKRQLVRDVTTMMSITFAQNYPNYNPARFYAACWEES